jgi:hypothetical protein
MNQHSHEIEKLSPPSLLAGFTKSRLVAWIVVATLIHVVVIGALSFDYIRDTWINPEGAALRKQQAEAAAREALKAATETNTAAAATAPSNTKAATVTTAKPAKQLTEEERLAKERNNTPVMKEITETASTNDIPREPDALDLSIRDIKIK